MDHPGTGPAEQAAALLTAAGMARMPARVMMALVGSPDEGYTAAELGERLGVSAAAVSGAVRYLV
jgi:DNA-directed RNA polymerase specialized sigma24 family protein